MTKYCQQVTSVYQLLFDAQKNSLSVRKFADVNKNQQSYTNAISYLNDSNFWQENES